MDTVKVTIDRKPVEVSSGSTILEAAEKAGVQIPTLCHHPDQSVKANCRVCVVEVEGSRVLQPACAFPVNDGMVIGTRTPRVLEARRTVVELLLAHHPQDCLICERNTRCDLQDLTQELGIRDVAFPRDERHLPIDDSSGAVLRDPDKCINCRRCIEACTVTQGIGILSTVNRGYDSVVSTGLNRPLTDVPCVLCGQCIQVCPVGALREKDDTDRVWQALADPQKHVVVQTAPAVRVALGEDLGMPLGSRSTKKMVTALRRLGFDRVFDTDFTADLTILEEGNELLSRIKNGGKLPMMTSCSPGWIKFMEHYYPDMLENLSTCKSPQQMFGALAKTYYPENVGVDPSQVFSVSIMPCTAKKFEAGRPEMNSSGYPDVDAVLTTRELAQMIAQAGIDYAALPEEDFDNPLGISTGAAVIFGATGGVMEAALRTVYEVVTGKELANLDFEMVRGMDGIRKATVTLELPDDGGTIDVKVAVAHTLAHARELMELVRSGEEELHFIEVMTCPAGCIGGGGQPRPTTDAVRRSRIEAIYDEDKGMTLRKSHENPAVKTLYEEFLKEPLGEKSHHLLHTKYSPRSLY